MAGQKAVQPSPVTVHDVYVLHQFGVIRRTETVEVRLAKPRGKLVGQGYHQCNHHQNDYPVRYFGILKNDIQQHGSRRNPDLRAGHRPHESVPKQRMAAVDFQQQFFIQCYQLLYIHNQIKTKIIRSFLLHLPEASLSFRLPDGFPSSFPSNCRQCRLWFPHG